MEQDSCSRNGQGMPSWKYFTPRGNPSPSAHWSGWRNFSSRPAASRRRWAAGNRGRTPPPSPPPFPPPPPPPPPPSPPRHPRRPAPAAAARRAASAPWGRTSSSATPSPARPTPPWRLQTLVECGRARSPPRLADSRCLLHGTRSTARGHVSSALLAPQGCHDTLHPYRLGALNLVISVRATVRRPPEGTASAAGSVN